MREPVKLTKAQEAFLWLLNSEPTPADPHYRPARKLVEMGLATRERRSGRLSFYWVFTITPAGRALLSQENRG